MVASTVLRVPYRDPYSRDSYSDSYSRDSYRDSYRLLYRDGSQTDAFK